MNLSLAEMVHRLGGLVAAIGTTPSQAVVLGLGTGAR